MANHHAFILSREATIVFFFFLSAPSARRDRCELEARTRESRLTRRNTHALRFRNA